MATSKIPNLTVMLPKRLVQGAQGAKRPADQSERDTEVRNAPLYAQLNNSASNYRSATNMFSLFRHLARAEGPFSTAVHNTLEVAKSGYKVSAYDSVTHQFSPEGTALAQTILAMFDTSYEYEGFDQTQSMDGVVGLMLREAMLTGMIAAELVLNKARQPSKLQVVGAETLRFYSDGNGGFYPGQIQAGSGDPVKLNIPTFFASWMHPDPDIVEPRSMMESAVKMLIYFEEQMEDIRRVVRQSGHNRLQFTLNYEALKKTAPRDVVNDPVKLRTYMESVRDTLRQQLEEIEPEQAFVMFDAVKGDILKTGLGSTVDYTPLMNLVVGQYATGMKTPPSVLGLRLESGSQALGNVETLIFLKSVKALHEPAETVLSRALTLAARLFGSDVYVWYRFNPLDLRPEAELQAFRSMQQAQILEKLSLGFITDDEAALEMGCFPRPPGSPNLSGTGFHKAGPPPNTSPGDSAMGRTLQPAKDAPRSAGGKDNAQR